MIININNVCTCCNLFILFGTSILLTKIHSEFILVIEAAIIVNDDLNYCGRADNRFHFCNFCYDMIIEKKILKFGSANYITILLCPKYPVVFSNLTLIKKAFIACTHFVMFVIKLKPNGTYLTASYH